MKRLKAIKDTLLCAIEDQMCGNLALVNTKELGEVVDMVKDISETMYYCSVVEAMGKSSTSKSKATTPNHYTDQMAIAAISYDEHEEEHHHKEWDEREGKSPLKRKEYLIAKEEHKEKDKLLHELDEYLHELSSDLTEIFDKAMPEEKVMLKTKITAMLEKMK